MSEKFEYIRILDVIKIKRENGRMDITNKSEYVLSCRLKGESSFFYNGEHHVVKRGDILYVPKNASYIQGTDGEELIGIHLEAYGDMPDKIQICRTSFPDEICALFERVEKLWRGKNGNYIFGCLSYVYEILFRSNLSINSSAVPAMLLPSVEYMNTNMYDVDFCIDDAYRKSFVSRTYFNKMFRDFFGTTPTDYVNKSRINKAKLLLESGNYTREEIAFLCGFVNVKYFYVLFKKYTAVSTGEYLKKIRIEKEF